MAAAKRSGAGGSARSTSRREIVVRIAASADGYIARPDGDLDWLTSRPAPKGFYGINAFMNSIDTLVMGRATYTPLVLREAERFDDGLVQLHYLVRREGAPT